MQRIQEHIKTHLDLLRKKDKQAAKEIEAEIAGLLAAEQPADEPQSAMMGAPAEAPIAPGPAAMNEPAPFEGQQPVGAQYAA